MAAALTIVLWGMLGLFLLILLLLATPLRITSRLQSGSERTIVITVRAFGGLSPQLVVFDSANKKQKSPTERKNKPSPRIKGWSLEIGKLRRIVRTTPNFLVSLIRTLRIEKLSVDAEFGLGDPADTGEAYGMLAPFIFNIPDNKKYRIKLFPNFDQKGVWGDALIAIRVTPFVVIIQIAEAMWRILAPPSLGRK